MQTTPMPLRGAPTACGSATVIGAGLAGSEAAFQLAERGVKVLLIEQKPKARTPAQTSDRFCELVCSNSFRGAALTNAVGLLKEEMRRAGSLIMRAAAESAVPAGGALAVDREVFSSHVERTLLQHPNVTVQAEIALRIPAASAEHPVVLATGPLTGDALAEHLAQIVGRDQLAYYDAIAPIVSAESLDRSIVFAASRWDKGEDLESSEEAAYLNCPMDEEQYKAFVAAVLAAKKVEAREFEKVRYFEGCLPIETMAERGEKTLAFGPMKPVGLTDPRTGRWPKAVVQLRPEDAARTAYNMVGFQTRMTWGEQQRVFRMIPGMENAEFMRMGSVHRNTFVNSPELLDATLQLKAMSHVYLAGQVTGVEGYVESAACGLLVGRMLAERLSGREPVPPPPTTALGGLIGHLGRAVKDFQPSNITWALVPPPDNPRLKKEPRYTWMAERALTALDAWLNPSA